MINYEDDELAVSREQLQPLAALVGHMVNQQKTVEQLEAQLKDAKKSLRRVEEIDIPTMMAEVGLEAVTMEDGSQLSIKEQLYASISAKHKAQAVDWLMNNGHESLVKEDVVVPFDRGQASEVAQLSRLLSDSGYTYKVSEAINTASVKALIKELLESGTDVPLDVFGAYFVRKAVLK